ncbi:unnamed protein product [Rhizoctonia solani]|uniref:Uncharacterized protein n=1 Tax=Rhizoctonia solani TaxID=456999 RepID=A0A8H3B8V6_9AGAM|nr:unnamed protein product [Rhizoctonia solani]
MHVLSFGRRPTIPGPAPGSSYYVANASVKGMRVALGLADPVRVQFGAFGVADGLLSDWCELHSQASVQAMQLRKERKGPFFHEYIAFSMKNSQGGTTYFRLDRRQLPNEGCPLDCTEDAGVEPYETIEQITDFEDSMYSPSDCLVRLDFKDGLRLQLIIDICREISQHDLAGVYTVQRYNCYFYAQTVLLLALCKEYDWYEDSIWKSESTPDHPEGTAKTRMPLSSLSMSPRIKIRILDRQPEYHISASDESYYSPIALPPAGFDIHWKSPLRMIRPKRNSSGSGIMREIDIGYLQQYLSDMIYSHSVRVGQYALLLKCTAQGVDTDIKKAMDEIWANRWLILGQVEEVDPILSTKRRRRQQRRETYEWDGFGDGHDLSHRQQAGARKRGTVG